MNEPTSPNRPLKTVKKRTATRIRDENVPSFYANSAEIKMSVYDIRMAFGFVEEATEDSLVIREVGQVIMSPQHAKSLLLLLKTRLEIYEKQFGPLPDVSGTIREQAE